MFNQYPQPIQQMPNQNYVFGFVHGKAGADSFFVPTNCAAILFDLDGEYFYFKQTDQYGVPYAVRVFTYAERQTQGAPIQQQNGESFYQNIKAEFDALTARVAALEGAKHDAV